ncbi:preprotein translocase subunit SecE (plasmid) [Limosilactobacillus reuteri]|uniref:Preprotein translocase subunit SecE n=1 Tax=Limosilactobacillus reuteri TaxID=1598 RepID=A0A517D8G7_LIMRT|nr:preprotein translocase subunit SecE [Limosilactobacillus reuteri]
MYYLSRVWKQLRQVTWQGPVAATKSTLVCLIVIEVAALCYWGLDLLMQKLIML